MMPERTDNNTNVDDIEDCEAEVNRVLFLRGISEKTTEDELYELFLQAGPLEKVAIPQNKNIAFVTYKHSISAPYAKELFCDTRLHGRLLNIDFRTGSIHSGSQRQSRHDSHHQAASGGSYNRQQHRQNHSHSDHHSRDSYSSYASGQGQQNGLLGSPYQAAQDMIMQTAALMHSPFATNPLSMSNVGIQGYRSSDNREYEPQYVSFESPPSNFRGSAPVNHPSHPVAFDVRRQRLLSQQRYVTQADMQRNQDRYGNQRR